jgi:hypothetical protein
MPRGQLAENKKVQVPQRTGQVTSGSEADRRFDWQVEPAHGEEGDLKILP